MMLQQLFLFATAPGSCEKSFLGLTPWYHYLPSGDFDASCNIKNFHFLSPGPGGGDLPLVLLAIVDDLLRVAGIVAVGFVLYGAIQYIASQGSSEQTAKAQSTVINALIGLAAAVTAIAFVSFLGNSLGGTPNPGPTNGKISSGNLPQVGVSNNPVTIIINIVLGIAGALALLMIVVSGLRYITSAGSPEKTSRAKNGIIYSIVGLVIAISADAIVNFVLGNL